MEILFTTTLPLSARMALLNAFTARDLTFRIPDCPEYKFQNDFRTYATTHCLIFAEAKKILRPKKSGTQSHNSTPAPSIFNFNFSSYPDLGDTPAPSSNVPYFPQTSYSEVARSVPTPNCSGSTSTTARLFSKTRDPQNKQGP